ncbi:hypothetical protein ACFY9H_31540 [Streptomyces bacillaris]
MTHITTSVRERARGTTPPHRRLAWPIVSKVWSSGEGMNGGM